MNIKQLKYDLSMQCALADVMYERSKSDSPSSYDIRSNMLEKFESYYQHYTMYDKNRLTEVINALD